MVAEQDRKPALDVEALYVALDRARRQRRVSWRQLCREAGIPGSSTTTRLGRGLAPSAENLARLLVWLGQTDLKPYLMVMDGAKLEMQAKP